MGRRIIRIDRVLALWLASLMLTGCAGEILPPVGLSHPASVNAPESPPTVVSTTLDVQTRPMPTTAPPADGRKDMHDHSHGVPGVPRVEGVALPNAELCVGGPHARDTSSDTTAQHSLHDKNEVQPSTTPGQRGGQP